MYQQFRKPIVIFAAFLFHLLVIFHLLFSPVIIVAAAWKGIINASFIVFIVLFLSSLYFGRAYCSWFCPGCAVQEIMNLFIKRRSKNTKALYIKYFIFAIWIGAIVTGYFFNGLQMIDLTYGMYDISIDKKVILTIGAIVLIAPLTAVFGQFASCKYICWQVPFLIIGTKIRDYFHFRGLSLKAVSEKCNNCAICNQKCPMNIDVTANVKSKKMSDTEYILCGNCIDNCKHQVIRFSFRK